MNYKFKLTQTALIGGFLFLNACSDKKEYVEIVKEDSETVEPELETPEIPESAEVPDIDEDSIENKLVRGKNGIVIGTLDPEKPGYMINPYTLETMDVRGIPAGTKVRDPHDPNPNHILIVPSTTK